MPEELQRPTAELEAPDMNDCENVLPLTEWLDQKEQDPESCPPCELSVITPWYSDMLKEQGYTELAQRIDDVVGQEGEETDSRKLVETLDEIKESVDNVRVKETLTLYDCMMQDFQGESEKGEPDG